MKQLLRWLTMRLLWPILKLILANVLNEFVQWLILRFKEMLARWRDEDLATATSDEERERTRARYQRRSEELDRLANQCSAEIPKIVEQAMLDAETERDKLLRGFPEKKGLRPGNRD